MVAGVPGPVRAKQIVPRIGLPSEMGKIEDTRPKLNRLVEWAGWSAPAETAVPAPYSGKRTPGGARAGTPLHIL